MAAKRNWTAVGIGLEVVAGVLVTIEPIAAIPFLLLGAVVIIGGLFPEQVKKYTPKTLRPKGDTGTAEKEKWAPKFSTLKDLMHKEFPGVFCIGGDISLQMNGWGKELKIHVVLYQDPQSGSEFLGAYFPGHDKAFEAVAWVFLNSNQIIQDLKGDKPSSITIVGAGELSPPTTVGAKFSGKVYIYYDVPLSLQQLAKLEKIAEENQLRVTFRDHTYLMSGNRVNRTERRSKPSSTESGRGTPPQPKPNKKAAT